ncbi:MAG: septum formation initiator family protein [Butyrivibrio sp.]|nr:septum formation initiator family protein [Butyrivibrio sp.]
MATRARYKRRRFQNTEGIALVGVVVLILFAVISIKSVSLMSKVREYEAKEAALQSQIDMEEARGQEIAEFEKETQTRKYREKIATEKLGLVYPGETIFKKEEK